MRVHVLDIKGSGGRGMAQAGDDAGKSAYELALHEEMMDGVMKTFCDKARWDLWTESLKVGREYLRRVAVWFENRREGTRWENNEAQGDVVIGIEQLMDYWRRGYGTFKRKEDTYHCCLTLHLCTKLLACERVKDPKRPSKDDRFKRIYEGDYQFRRDWVAFLGHVVAYVESMYVSDKAGDQLYLNAKRLRQMAHVYRKEWWNGYDWSAVKGHIQAAHKKIRHRSHSNGQGARSRRRGNQSRRRDRQQCCSRACRARRARQSTTKSVRAGSAYRHGRPRSSQRDKKANTSTMR